VLPARQLSKGGGGPATRRGAPWDPQSAPGAGLGRARRAQQGAARGVGRTYRRGGVGDQASGRRPAQRVRGRGAQRECALATQGLRGRSGRSAARGRAWGARAGARRGAWRALPRRWGALPRAEARRVLTRRSCALPAARRTRCASSQRHSTWGVTGVAGGTELRIRLSRRATPAGCCRRRCAAPPPALPPAMPPPAHLSGCLPAARRAAAFSSRSASFCWRCGGPRRGVRRCFDVRAAAFANLLPCQPTAAQGPPSQRLLPHLALHIFYPPPNPKHPPASHLGVAPKDRVLLLELLGGDGARPRLQAVVGAVRDEPRHDGGGAEGGVAAGVW
jgi:hypothetical protein